MSKKRIFSLLLLFLITITAISVSQSPYRTIPAWSTKWEDLGYSNEDLERLIYYYTTEVVDTIMEFEIPRYFTIQCIRYHNCNPDYLGNYYEVSGGTIKDLLYTINTVNHPNLLKESSVKEHALFKDSNTILVNKNYYLEKTDLPKDLTEISIIPYIKRPNETMTIKREVFEHYLNLYEQAKAQNLKLVIFSAYRTYEKQSLLYYSINNQDDNYVARPGYSEHQTGLALDISTVDAGLMDYFENTPEYMFLKHNAHNEGFILRYPKYKEKITGYHYEPWHFRYVGKSIATTIYHDGITYEEYLARYVEIP